MLRTVAVAAPGSDEGSAVLTRCQLEVTAMHDSTQPLLEVTYLLPCSRGLTQQYTHDLCLGCCAEIRTGVIKSMR